MKTSRDYRGQKILICTYSQVAMERNEKADTLARNMSAANFLGPEPIFGI